MKYYESHYDEFLATSKKNNYHPEIQIPSNIKNTILFGPTGVGKYTQMLRLLVPHSPSGLKYDKKITLTTDKIEYTYHISDIHYEVDMALLGCNAKTVWHELYSQIMDIISIKSNKKGYIVCKNFHAIHPELLDVMYSYIAGECVHRDKSLSPVFILLTDHISFIPNSILQSFDIIRVRRPDYKKAGICAKEITNAKSLKITPFVEYKDNFKMICANIIAEMETPSKISLSHFRETIYDILSYNLNAHECIWTILSHFIQKGKIKDIRLLDRVYTFLKYYNNNYRPIYHLESILLYITNETHNECANATIVGYRRERTDNGRIIETEIPNTSAQIPSR